MKANEIDSAVQIYREQQLGAAHRRIDALAFRHQTLEMIDAEMQGVDVRANGFRASLGTPDDQPDEPEVDESPVPKVTPGVKQEV